MEFSVSSCVAPCFKEFLSQKSYVYKLFSSLQTKGNHILSVGMNQMLEKLKFAPQMCMVRRNFCSEGRTTSRLRRKSHCCAASYSFAPQVTLLRRNNFLCHYLSFRLEGMQQIVMTSLYK